MKINFKKIIVYFFIFIFLIISIFPIYYLLVISSLTFAEFRYSLKPIFIPSSSKINSIFLAFFQKPFLNSLIISFSVTLISLCLGIAAGYSFAKLWQIQNLQLKELEE